MQVFVVSHRSSEDDDWQLEAVCSSALNADCTRDELFKIGALFVRIEQTDLDANATDQIVVYIYDATLCPITVNTN